MFYLKILAVAYNESTPHVRDELTETQVLEKEIGATQGLLFIIYALTQQQCKQ